MCNLKKNGLPALSVLCLILVVLLTPLTVSAAQIPEVLVAWCPISQPSNSTSQAPTCYIPVNASATLTRSKAGAAINGAGTGTNPESTPYTYSTTGWNTPVGQWWQLSNISTSGFENIALSFSVRGSDTGPRDFSLQYSTDGTNWDDIPDSGGNPATYTAINSYTHQVGPFSLPAAAGNSDTLFIRFLNTSTYSVANGTTAAAGVNNLFDIIIAGTQMIDDGRETISEWLISLENADSNHTYYASHSSEKPHFEATGGTQAASAVFWVEKTTGSQSQPINTALTGGHALYAGGVRYAGLGDESFCIIEMSGAGFADIEVSWAMRSSNAAPANFQLQYSINYDPDNAGSATWVPVGSNIALTQDIPIKLPQAYYTGKLPAEADNQQNLYIRLYVIDNVSITGGQCDVHGAFGINNIIITGKALSNDAGLAFVASQPIVAGGEAGTLSAPKTAGINVANSVASVAFGDIVATHANAAVALYSDSGFSTAASSIALTAGEETHLYIKVTAEDGTELYYDVTVNRAAQTYTVTYKANGGAETDIVETYNEGATPATKDASTFTYAGYTLSAWNTMVDGTGTAYAPGDAFAPISADVTLYAQWAQKSATISNVIISGTVGTALGGGQTATIMLTYDTAIAGGLTGIDASDWFTDLPTGLTVTATAPAGAGAITLIFGGTPMEASVRLFHITIPGAVLTGGSAIPVTTNSDARFYIAAIPNPPSPLPKTGDDFPILGSIFLLAGLGGAIIWSFHSMKRKKKSNG